jgi:hypothetical protein
MAVFTYRESIKNQGFCIFFEEEIGMPLTQYEAEVVVDWLNNTQFSINLYTFFSFEQVKDKNSEDVYQILDQTKKVGDIIISKRDVVAIVNWLNSSLKKLKEKLDKRIYTPITGEEPTEEEIKAHMISKKMGYYIAKEDLRKIKYKRL